ncbi:MAG TPA: ABC transporter permease [Solirubrobacteraceae bacterium]|nr:ABC transporter permease [Solirubrobacteraceae bacterium]
MIGRATPATAARVLTQLRNDPRTIALLLLVPCVLVTLLRYVFDGRPAVFDMVAPPLLGIFPLIAMFLVTSITMLRERVGGTLERLMTMPLAKLDLLAGYALGFGMMAAAQAALASLVAFGLLGVDSAGSPLAVGALAVLNAILGMALGLLVSAFARTEFQAVQFMPAFIFPQLLLCGLFVPREQMAGWLQTASDLMPMTYAYDALHRVAADGALGARGRLDVAVIAGATLLALALGSVTLRRRTA